MHFSSTDIELAQELDANDPLSTFRQKFVIEDPTLIYLDGNSLGRLPKETTIKMQETIEQKWGERLIRGWNDGWINKPEEIGAKIAKIIGAQSDEVIVCDSTSINLFKLAHAALNAMPERDKVVSDVFNFPSDLYILQGIVDILGKGHRIELLQSDDNIHIDIHNLHNFIDDQTALVSLTHVAFKSAFMYDMHQVTQAAHEAGALILWDLSHSTGAVPLDLNGCNVDLAVGCTYKYLNGGPGSPAFLYVRRDLQDKLISPIWGWFADQSPFDFNLNFTPVKGISRFKTGTPSILSMSAIEPALDIILEAGIERLRLKSIRQTEYMIYLTDQWLLPLGFSLGSPRQSSLRGSHVSIRHPEAYRINRAMIEASDSAICIIPDFRTPDNIRMGVAPLYTTFTEINKALKRIKAIVEGGIYKQFSSQKLAVT
jgi:kynureninase